MLPLTSLPIPGRRPCVPLALLALALVGGRLEGATAMARPAVPIAVAGGEATAADPARLAPYERIGATVVFDARAGKVVAFGGWNGDRYFNDTWLLDPSSENESWVRMSPEGAHPAPRAWHSAVYDPVANRMVVFGGQDSLGRRNDVWMLDLQRPGGAWYTVELEGDAPPARREHSAVYDAANQRMVVYGGSTLSAAAADSWSLSLVRYRESWSELAATAERPAGRFGHTAVYDPGQERMVVYGGAFGPPGQAGEGGSTGLVPPSDAVWSLTLRPGEEAWTRLEPTGAGPAARSGHSGTWVTSPSPGMLIWGGQVAEGIDAGAWHLFLGEGPTWSSLAPAGAGPDARAWSTLAYEDFGSRAMLFGGKGPQTDAGGHWYLLLRSAPEWRAFAPRVDTDLAPGFDVGLEIEDAAAHVPVLVTGGLGEAGQTLLYASARLSAGQPSRARDIVVTLTVDGTAFGTVIDVGQKHEAGSDPAQWSRAQPVGGGRFRVTGVSLLDVGGGRYERTVVFRIPVSRSVRDGDVALSVEACAAGACRDDEGGVRVTSAPRAVVLASRRALFAAYDEDETVDLLRRLYRTVRGSEDEAPPGVVVYVDRYVPDARTWDNTAVNYASSTAANRAARAIDDWLDEAFDGRAPSDVLLVGDDGVFPFHRQRDPESDEYRHLPDREADHPSVSTGDPVMGELVRSGYYLTDAPYAAFGPDGDWQAGDVGAAIGRVVGATAADLAAFVEAGSLGPDPAASRFVTASAAEQPIERSGDNNDAVDAAATLGYAHTPELVGTDPDKTRITTAMNADTAVVVAAMRGEAGGLQAPGGAGDGWSDPWIVGAEVPAYDVGGWMAANRPFFQLVSSRTGLGHTADGRYGSLVYGLAGHGAAGILASAGLSHSPAPPGGALAPDQALDMAVWEQVLDGVSTNGSLGAALTRAKQTYDLGWDAEDRKTVQAYTLYGVPWTRLRSRPGAVDVDGARSLARVARPATSVVAPRALRATQAGPTYAVTRTLEASAFATEQVGGGYALVTVPGMRQHADQGEPVLALGAVDFHLPVTATVLAAVVTPTDPVDVAGVDIPAIETASSHPDAPAPRYVAAAQGSYPAESHRLEVSRVGHHQLARVLVRPVSYDASAKVATVYRSLAVRLEYEAVVPVAVTRFGAARASYAPGETVAAGVELFNVSDAPVVLTATLAVRDVTNRHLRATEPVTVVVAEGSGRQLPFDWVAEGADDAYFLDLDIRGPLVDSALVAARGIIQVDWGSIEHVDVPERVPIGEAASLEVTVRNRLGRPASALVSVAVVGRDGGVVSALSPRLVTLPAGEAGEAAFDWLPPPDVGGEVDVRATVWLDGQVLGPETRRLTVESAAMNAIWLPVARRRH